MTTAIQWLRVIQRKAATRLRVAALIVRAGTTASSAFSRRTILLSLLFLPQLGTGELPDEQRRRRSYRSNFAQVGRLDLVHFRTSRNRITCTRPRPTAQNHDRMGGRAGAWDGLS